MLRSVFVVAGLGCISGSFASEKSQVDIEFPFVVITDDEMALISGGGDCGKCITISETKYECGEYGLGDDYICGTDENFFYNDPALCLKNTIYTGSCSGTPGWKCEANISGGSWLIKQESYDDDCTPSPNAPPDEWQTVVIFWETRVHFGECDDCDCDKYRNVGGACEVSSCGSGVPDSTCYKELRLVCNVFCDDECDCTP